MKPGCGNLVQPLLGTHSEPPCVAMSFSEVLLGLQRKMI